MNGMAHRCHNTGKQSVHLSQADSIRSLEEISFNAWPALNTISYDGWLLRMADGNTRRANSVNPIYPSSLPLEEKVSHCEAFYAAQGLATVFKITPAVQPADLDQMLERLSYRREAVTSVQLLDIADLHPAVQSASVSIWDTPNDEWLASFCAFNGVSIERRRIMEQMLAKIVPSTAYARIKHGEETVAVGLAVREREHIGLFDIVTAPQWRGQGFGTQLIRSLLQWGYEDGAQQAYLQVMTDNAAAIALYAKLGFSETYQYWYRVKNV